MGRKHKRNHQRGPQAPQPQRPPQQQPQATPSTHIVSPDSPIAVLEASAATDGLAVPASAAPAGAGDPVSTGMASEDEASLRNRLAVLINEYRRAKTELDERELGLMGREEALAKDRTALDDTSAALEQQRRDFDDATRQLEFQKTDIQDQKTEIQERLALLLEREERLSVREADADAGFIARREAALEELQRAHNELLDRNRKLH
jgi:hypothetical protein